MSSLVTNADVVNTSKILIKAVQTKQNRIEIEKGKDKQNQREVKYVNGTYRCTLPQMSKLRNNLGNLNEEKLKTIVSTQFYNPEVMEAVMCTAQSIFYTQNLKTGRVAPNERLRSWLVSLQQVGSESAYGYAIKADFGGGNNNFFVIKAPRDPDDEDLIHELFVGLQVNKLRRFLPNFVYVYGGFSCSPPFIAQDKNVAAWCNNDVESIKYVLYENIEDSVSMDSFIYSGCSFSAWLEQYLQVLYALDKAYKEIKFTHYDLHPGNILLRNLNSNVSISYDTKNGKEYVNTNKIATIIDFGRCHVQYGNRSYGYWDGLVFNIYPERGFPMYDAYKLLLFSALYARDSKNLECLQGISRIVAFFNRTDSLNSIFQEQYPERFWLPYTSKTRQVKLSDLIKFIRTNIAESNTIVSKFPRHSVLSCLSDQLCYNSGQVAKQVGLRDPLNARTAFEYFDLVSRLQDEGNTSSLNEVSRNFDYNAVLVSNEEYFQNQGNNIKKLISSIGTAITIVGASIQALFNQGYLSDVKNFSLLVAQGYDEFQHFKTSRDALVFMAKNYNDNESIFRIDRFYDSLNSYWSLLNQYYQYVLNNYNYLNLMKLGKPNEVNLAVRKNPNYIWYWRELENIVKVFN